MPEEPPAEVPSPSLPAAVNSRLPAASRTTLAGRARDYVEAASSANTRRAYAADWKHFASWCRRQGIEMFPPDPQTVGLYITACASGKATRRQEAEFRVDDRTPALLADLELCAARPAAGSEGPPHRHGHGRHPQQARRPASAEGGGVARGSDRHAGNARPRHPARPARPGHAAARLRRRPAPFRDRRPGFGRDQTEDGRGWVEISRQGHAGHACAARPAGARSRSAAARPMPPAPSSPWKPGSSWRESRTVPCSAVSPARARRSAPIGSTTRRSPAWSNGPRWPPACAAICRKASAQKALPAIRCAPASPPRPRSMSAMCKSSSATPQPK